MAQAGRRKRKQPDLQHIHIPTDRSARVAFRGAKLLVRILTDHSLTKEVPADSTSANRLCIQLEAYLKSSAEI